MGEEHGIHSSNSSNKFVRTDSICPTSESDLLDAVLVNNIAKVGLLVRKYPELLTKKYTYPYYKPILHIACLDKAQTVKPATVETLIENGASLTYSDETTSHRNALHQATLGLNPDILRIVIKHIGKYINSTTETGQTALILLIKEGNNQNANFMECIRILINADIDINKLDRKGVPAILHAARKQLTSVIELLLTQEHINLDSNDKTRNALKDLDIDTSYVSSREPNLTSNEALYHLLAADKFEDILATPNLDKIDLNDTITTSESLLQLACKKNQVKVAKHLLNAGADSNLCTPKQKSSPLLITAQNGNPELFRSLLENHAYVDETILHELMRKIDTEISDRVNHKLCFEALITKYPNLDVNAADSHGNDALHYAARYGNSKIVLQLLKMGASLANRSKYGIMNVEELDYETLKEHFDSCITGVPANNLDRESMKIILDYKTLMPTKLLQPKHVDDLEAQQQQNCCFLATENDLLQPETDVIIYISKTPELRELLKHPLITSLLYLKWYKIRHIFYINLTFYLLFILTLLTYILFSFKSDPYMYAICFTMCLGCTFFMLLARELFQMIVCPVKYFTSFENWIEMALIIIVACMLFPKTPTENVRRQYCAMVILLAAFELVLLIGQHPRLSTNIVMLRTVSTNFFKFFALYSILIVAFALSFYVLFNDVGSADNEENPFANPGLSIFKTIVMLTGEFEAADIKFDTFPFVSHLIFMLFVITIAIILLNLLNGLAVSDTQEIKHDAELYGFMSRTQYIEYAEALLLGNILPSTIINFYRLYCCSSPKNTEKRKLIMSRVLAQRICLFPDFLKNYRLVVLPNQSGQIVLDENADMSTINSSKCKIRLDAKSIKEARYLIQDKKESERTEQELKERRAQEQQIITNQDMILKRLLQLEKGSFRC